MTNVFVEIWEQRHPNDTIIYREVGQENIPHVTEKWIAGVFKPSELRNADDLEALKLSDQLVAELKDVDVIVLGTPMYNWSVPPTDGPWDPGDFYEHQPILTWS